MCAKFQLNLYKYSHFMANFAKKKLIKKKILVACSLGLARTMFRTILPGGHLLKKMVPFGKKIKELCMCEKHVFILLILQCGTLAS